MKHLKHIFHSCHNDSCYTCSGGLSYCEVCGGAEGSLLTFCPGYKLNSETLDACYNGNIKDLVRFKQRKDIENYFCFSKQEFRW